ncbi:MAG: hypothetical protein WC584_05025 [Candidatus Pacearchaeota archaeon]
MVLVLGKENKKDLFGVCSDVVEMFREGNFGVQIYPDKLDEMDIADKTNVNLIIYGDDCEDNFCRIMDNLINYGLRFVSQSNHRNLSRKECSYMEYNSLFEITGKRIKIRDRTSAN